MAENANKRLALSRKRTARKVRAPPASTKQSTSARLLACKLLATEVISGIADVEQRVELSKYALVTRRFVYHTLTIYWSQAQGNSPSLRGAKSGEFFCPPYQNFGVFLGLAHPKTPSRGWWGGAIKHCWSQVPLFWCCCVSKCYIKRHKHSH